MSNGKLTMGFLGSLLSMFAPLASEFKVICLVISVDFLSGIWAYAKVNRQFRFSSKKAYNTVKKLVWSLTLIWLAHVGVNEFQIWLEFPKIIAGIIFGFEFWSILENACKITEHPIFIFLSKFMENNINKQIKDEEIEKNLNETIFKKNNNHEE